MRPGEMNKVPQSAVVERPQTSLLLCSCIADTLIPVGWVSLFFLALSWTQSLTHLFSIKKAKLSFF